MCNSLKCLLRVRVFKMKLFILLSLVGVALPQYASPPILGTNYHTADQTRHEFINHDGSVQGQYSYLDPSGKTISVKYTAGRNGYQVQDAQPQIYQPQSYQPHSYQPQSYQPYQPPQIPQIFKSNDKYQPYPKYTQAIPQNLFQPALHPFPAATAGQIKNYQEALQEEAEELQKNNFQQNFPSTSARSHVNVKSNQGYNYEIHL